MATYHADRPATAAWPGASLARSKWSHPCARTQSTCPRSARPVT